MPHKLDDEGISKINALIREDSLCTDVSEIVPPQSSSAETDRRESKPRPKGDEGRTGARSQPNLPERVIPKKAKTNTAALAFQDADWEPTKPDLMCFRGDDVVSEELGKASSAESSSKRVQKLLQAASEMEDKGHVQEAFDILQHALYENPVNLETHEQLEALAEKTGEWEELCKVTTYTLDMAVIPQVKAFLALKTGDWCATKLGRPDYAVAYYQKVLEASPGNMAALRRLAVLYRTNEQWDDLSVVLHLIVEHTNDETQRKETLVELAGHLETAMNDTASAVQFYEYLLQIDPTNEPAFAALERIYHSGSHWQHLVALLQKKAEITNDKADEVDLRMHIAELFLEQAGDFENAAAELRAAQRLSPDCLPVLKALEHVYTQLEKPHSALEILEQQIEYTDDRDQKLALLERLGIKLDTEFADPQRAAMCFEDMLSIEYANQTAIDHLIDIYERQRKWQKLADVLKRRLQLIKDPTERLEMSLRLGSVYEKVPDSQKEAADCYNAVLYKVPAQRDALEGMIRIYEQSENWRGVKEILGTIVVQTTDREEKRSLFSRIASINEEHLEDLDGAVKYYRKALDLDGKHVPTLESLREVYVARREWLRVAKVLNSQLELEKSDSEKARLMIELGKTYLAMEDQSEAATWLRRALSTDPYNKSAAEVLLPILLKEKRHAEAEPLLSKLALRSGNRTARDKYYINLNLALVRQALGDVENSLEPARKAYEIDPTNPDAISVYGDALEGHGSWDEAFQIYNALRMRHSPGMSEDATKDLYLRLARAAFELRMKHETMSYVSCVLNIDPDHLEALKLAIRHFDKEHDYQNAIRYRLKLSRTLPLDDSVQTLSEIGDICLEGLQDRAAAIDAYLNALMAKPDDRRVLHKLIPIYSKDKRWKELIDTITRIAKQESDPEKLARFHYSMALIFRDKLDEYEPALQCLSAALDANPDDEQAFFAAQGLLRGLQDYRQLERFYRQMIFRIHGKGDQARELAFWRALAEIYRLEIGNFSSAAEAYKVLVNANPKDLQSRELLAACYFQTEDRAQEAIAEYRHLITLDPDNENHYRPLGSILTAQRRYDEAWCVSAALYLMGKANSQERSFYQRYAFQDAPQFIRPIDPKLYRILKHPNDKESIAAIFGVIVPTIIASSAKPISAFGFARNSLKQEKIDPFMPQLFKYVAGCLDMPETPELYFQKKEKGGLVYVNTVRPSSACGEHYKDNESYDSVLFMTARHLSYYRQGRVIVWLIPELPKLKTLLLAALSLGNQGYDIPKETKERVIQQAEILRASLGQTQLDALAAVVNRFLDAKTIPSIKKWVRGLEYTACRTGLLFCGDLVKASEAVRALSTLPREPSTSQLLCDLKVFSVSQDYADIRRSLGLCVHR